MATETITKIHPKIHFQPNWKKEEQCFQEEKVEYTHRNGKREFKPWQHFKSTPQLEYENWLEKVVNPDTNEFYTALDKAGNPIKGTGPKHTITQIIRFRRKDGKEFLYSLGELKGYDAFGNQIGCTCAKPEIWTRTIFDHQRLYDQKTNSTKMVTTGTLGSETVYEMPFNEKNLKQLVNLSANDTDISFTVKDERSEKAIEVKREYNMNKTVELFLKPFEYLFRADYISPQQKAELRQMAVDEGIIAPSTPLAPTEPAPPKGTYA